MLVVKFKVYIIREACYLEIFIICDDCRWFNCCFLTSNYKYLHNQTHTRSIKQQTVTNRLWNECRNIYPVHKAKHAIFVADIVHITYILNKICTYLYLYIHIPRKTKTKEWSANDKKS